MTLTLEPPMVDLATLEQEMTPTLIVGFAPIHKRAFGLAIGIALGTMLAFFTIMAIVRGLEQRSGLYLLAEYFYGYHVSWRGAAVIFGWGLVVGYVAGWFVAFCRNLALALVAFVRRVEVGASSYLEHI
jgi:hypothetical protein